MLPVLLEYAEQAREVLPPEVWDYIETGSGDEVSLGEAESAWRRWRLRPRVLRAVPSVSTETRVLGNRSATPVFVGATAFHGLAHPDGELATARGVSGAGSLLTLSTRSMTRLEEVAAAADGPWWFQVYVMRERSLTEAVVKRAAAAGATALVLTGDTPYIGRRFRGAGRPLPLDDDRALANLSPHLPPGTDPWQAAEQDPSVTLDDIDWLASISGLPVLVKGVLRGDEAVACTEAGAGGIVVSNHGGRQLDRAVPTAAALPEVVDAVAGRVPVLVDGGIRSGLDVLVALALGASAVFLGRPILWGLAADGDRGVQRVIDAVTDDLSHAMALAGTTSVGGLDRSLVAP